MEFVRRFLFGRSESAQGEKKQLEAQEIGRELSPGQQTSEETTADSKTWVEQDNERSQGGQADVLPEEKQEIGLELFPCGSLDEGKVRVVDSIEALDESKAWVFVRRYLDDDLPYTLAWSPCTGDRHMVRNEILKTGQGVLLAPGSSHRLADDIWHMLVDEDDNGFYAYHWSGAIFSSLTCRWEARPPQADVAEDHELGKQVAKTYFHHQSYNPKLKLHMRFPPLGENVKKLLIHWYKGTVYAVGEIYDHEVFKIFRWQEAGWSEMDSCAMYQRGETGMTCDYFQCEAGGRYACITHNNTDWMPGRFLVVYDLEEAKWHYHTGRATTGGTVAVVGTRGSNPALEFAFRAVLFDHEGFLPVSSPET